MAEGGCRCIKSSLECILDNLAEFDPSFGRICELVPILESTGVQTCGEKEADRIHDELFIGVWILTQ
jgi:hypothetical protein